MSNYPTVPSEYKHDTQGWLRRIANSLNTVLDGKINSTGSVTLQTGSTTTVVSDLRCGGNSRVFLQPTTSNAAAALTSTYISTVGKQTFTITHANNAQTDRTYEYALVG